MSPRVSVVVPVRNRRDLLADCLDGLAAQTFGDFEVVVVDDGSTDGSGDGAAARTIAGKPVRVIDGGGQGAVHARRVGVAAATGDVLAFTDSDCVPDRRWLERAVAAIDRGADIVNGHTRPARPLLPLERSMASGLEGLYPTCNMLYRRAAYERAGGFDDTMGGHWGFRPDSRSRGDGFGEDTLLAWRLIRSGATVAYEPDAVVEHAVFPPDFVDMLSRTARVAAFPAMIRDIPELRRHALVKWGWQLGGRTRVPVYVLAILLLGGRKRSALLAAAWWATLRYRELRKFPISRRRRLEVLPVEMALDVLTAGALVVGSARAKSLTL